MSSAGRSRLLPFPLLYLSALLSLYCRYPTCSAHAQALPLTSVVLFRALSLHYRRDVSSSIGSSLFRVRQTARISLGDSLLANDCLSTGTVCDGVLLLPSSRRRFVLLDTFITTAPTVSLFINIFPAVTSLFARSALHNARLIPDRCSGMSQTLADRSSSFLSFNITHKSCTREMRSVGSSSQGVGMLVRVWRCKPCYVSLSTLTKHRSIYTGPITLLTSPITALYSTGGRTSATI